MVAVTGIFSTGCEIRAISAYEVWAGSDTTGGSFVLLVDWTRVALDLLLVGVFRLVDSMGREMTDSRSLESDFSEGGTDDADLRRLFG